MNNARRKSLRLAIEHLTNAAYIITTAKEDEQYALDNMPENLQDSERYEMMENAVDKLEDAITSINEAKEYVDGAIA